MKHINSYILLPVLLLIAVSGSFAKTWSASDIEQPLRYDRNNYVANPDNILSQSTVADINSLLADINDKTGAQVAVAVIDNFSGGDIDRFATDLFENWGLGEDGADNGVLLVVAVNAHRYAFRTGRGIGSVITDRESGRIGSEILRPNFLKGRYDDGVLLAVREIHNKMTTPEAVTEIKEMSARAKENHSQTIWDVIMFYLWCCIGLTAVLGFWAIYKVRATRTEERHRRYLLLRPMLRILYGLSFVGLGIPVLVYLPMKQFLDNLRNGTHYCPNCRAKMHKLDEIHDNEHLTPAQDAEERFDSVDYDVWECPNCGEEDVYAFENPDSTLLECPVCHAKTARYVRDRVLKPPTSSSEGLAVKEFDCLNCKKRSQKPYKLPRQVNTAGIAAAASIPFILGGMGRGGGFGGGAGGGSFGGGHTGGGGASGSW